MTGSKGNRRDRWLAGLEPRNTVGRLLDDVMPPRSRCGQSLRLKGGSGLLGRHTESRTGQPTGGPDHQRHSFPLGPFRIPADSGWNKEGSCGLKSHSEERMDGIWSLITAARASKVGTGDRGSHGDTDRNTEVGAGNTDIFYFTQKICFNTNSLKSCKK